MNYTVQYVKFPSANGSSECTGTLYVPNGEVRGVVQLSHGMVDHVGRYTLLADALAAHGYVLAGNDHLGHGLTAKGSGDPYGYFADDNGRELVLGDLYTMNTLLRERFGMLPVLMGHSMGSFLSRLYAVRYPETVSGHIIHGTGGPMGAILPLGIGLVNLIILFRGASYRSQFVKNLAFSGYNSHFPKEEGSSAWLTRDLSCICGELADQQKVDDLRWLCCHIWAFDGPSAGAAELLAGRSQSSASWSCIIQQVR